MKILFLPFTFVLVMLFGLLLITTAVVSSLLSVLASFMAYCIVRMLIWQESEFLVRCATILGTQKITEEEK